MGKMMKISSLFKSRGGVLTVPLCQNTKTLSFRVPDDVFKTVNSVFLDPQQNGDVLEAETPKSWFTNSSETASFSTESDRDLDAESLETVVREVVRSERLFFEPGVTSSIMEEKEEDRRSRSTKKDDRDCSSPLDEISVAVAMESEDPYGDFRQSMEDMVRSNEGLVKDWECLEKMLGWYLTMNGKSNHDAIVSAFVDVLVGLACGGRASASASTSETTCYSTAVSSFPSSPVYSSQGQNEIEEEEEQRQQC